MSGILHVCATPIGNLEDITLRAIRILSEVDLIAAEDTRQAKILLDKYQITTPLTSYHKYNIRIKTQNIIGMLKCGKSVALVSDAGTPGICDPGHELIKSAVQHNIIVVAIPGPSAVIAALSISGISADNFVFCGFITKEVIEKLSNENRTAIFYEAPHRIIATLNKLKEVLGDRKVAVCRELTKKFEEVYRGTCTEIIPKIKPKGEFVVILEGAGGRIPESSDINPLMNELVKNGLSRKTVAKILSKHFGIQKNKLYRASLK